MNKKDSLLSFGYDKESGKNISLLTLNAESDLLCPHCFEAYKVKHSGYINAELYAKDSIITDKEWHNLRFYPKVDYVCECKTCGRRVTLIQCDTDLSDAIHDLNVFGFKTIASCEGHSNEYIKRMYIKFDKSVAIESKPEFWDYNEKDNCIEMKYATTEQLMHALTALYDCVKVVTGK